MRLRNTSSSRLQSRAIKGRLLNVAAITELPYMIIGAPNMFRNSPLGNTGTLEHGRGEYKMTTTEKRGEKEKNRKNWCPPALARYRERMQASVHQLEHKDGTLGKGIKNMAPIGFNKSEGEQEDGALQPPTLVTVSKSPNQCLKIRKLVLFAYSLGAFWRAWRWQVCESPCKSSLSGRQNLAGLMGVSPLVFKARCFDGSSLRSWS